MLLKEVILSTKYTLITHEIIGKKTKIDDNNFWVKMETPTIVMLQMPLRCLRKVRVTKENTLFWTGLKVLITDYGHPMKA